MFFGRVVWYQFVLCMLVLLQSAENTEYFTIPVLLEGRPWFNQIENVIASDLSVAAVYGFFLCSGYLFYRNYSWGKVPEKYKTRILGLVVPYVLWNLIFYFGHVVCTHIPPVKDFLHAEPVTVTWKGILDAVLYYRYCPGFWFLQALIIFVAVSPVLYLLIMNRYLGVAVLVILLLLEWKDPVYLNMLKIGSFSAGDLIGWFFVFAVGAYLGRHASETVENNSPGWTLLLTSLILAVIAFWFFRQMPGTLSAQAYGLMFSAALWCLIGRLPLPGTARWQRNTFVAYVIHIPIVKGINHLISSRISTSMWPGFLVFLLLPVLVFLLSALLRKLCGGGESAVWKCLSGNRG